MVALRSDLTGQLIAVMLSGRPAGEQVIALWVKQGASFGSSSRRPALFHLEIAAHGVASQSKEFANGTHSVSLLMQSVCLLAPTAPAAGPSPAQPAAPCVYVLQWGERFQRMHLD
jgi:hypothetical protein